jgi:biopolymer transport protein ExbD
MAQTCRQLSESPMRIESVRGRPGRLGLAPLVDVVFLLLIFFMLVANLEQTRVLPIEVKDAKGERVLQPALLVYLRTDGSVEIGGMSADVAELTTRVLAQLSVDLERQVLVAADAPVPLQRLIAVMDALRGMGVRNLGLAQR